MKKGDYVRTKDGYISKIKEIRIDVYTDVGCWSEDYISNSSSNIIDLIEVGDYVNGERVDFINKRPKHTTIECGGDDFITYKNEDIESVVTKEQFERMEYKL